LQLGDVGWKRVDYAWVAVGALGLLIQAVQLTDELHKAIYEESHKFRELALYNLNQAVADLSGPSVCKPSEMATANGSVPAIESDLAKVCAIFSEIRPKSARFNSISPKLIKFIQDKKIDDFAYVDSSVSLKINKLKSKIALYNELDAAAGKAAENTHTGVWSVIFRNIGSVLLVIAFALRLAKVTGEVRLKTHPGPGKETNGSSQKITVDLQSLATVDGLKVLEKKIHKDNVSLGRRLDFLNFLLVMVGVGVFLLVLQLGFGLFRS
jgi:hypothetical protein